MKEFYEILNKKYGLEELVEGALNIDDVLSDINVIDFLSYSKYRIEDVEDYILKNIFN